MKKKNMLIVILSLLVVFLSGYLIYDKVLLDNGNNNQIVDSSVYDNVELNDYKYYDGSYGMVKILSFDDPSDENKKYNIRLDLDGKTIYYVYNNGEKSNEKILLNNVVDIVSFADGAGSVYVESCYVLDKNGNVYRYKLSDLIDGKIIGEKLNITDVEKLIHVDWASKDSMGGSWAVLAITKDGNYVELTRASV